MIDQADPHRRTQPMRKHIFQVALKGQKQQASPHRMKYSKEYKITVSLNESQSTNFHSNTAATIKAETRNTTPAKPREGLLKPLRSHWNIGRAQLRDFHLPLSLATFSIRFQFIPVCFTSASVDRRFYEEGRFRLYVIFV